MKKLLVYILGTFLIAACLPRDMQMPQSPLLSTLERKSGLIAYIGVDGNIYVVDQGGKNPNQLTNDAVIPQNQGDPVLFYEQPTWSHDGSQLAFAGLYADGKQTKSQVLVANMDDDAVNQIYTSQSEHPVYLNWSPDNTNVDFISTNTTQGNFILQSIPAQGGDRTILDTGSPYYWSWAPDGKTMIVHAGGTATSAPEHVAFLNIDSATVTEQGLDATPAAFQAPAWSPDGSHIAIARSSDKKNEIVITDAAGENAKAIGTFSEKTAFAWSPDSTRIAYLAGTQALSAGTVGSLHVMDLETSKEIAKEEGDIIGFFWSPSGKEIAYFVLMQAPPDGSSSGGSTDTSPQLVLGLHVLDVTSGKSRDLFIYRPTQQFLNILPYFDQYHQSFTVWSPDNNNLVLSFIDKSGNPGIAIVAASGNLEPRIIAEGFLGVWSWK